MATVERMLGKAIRRLEDPRFITGRGTYTDDVKMPGDAPRDLRPEHAGPRPHRQRRHPEGPRPPGCEGGLHRQGPRRRRSERHPGGVAASRTEDHRLSGHRRRPGAARGRGGGGGGGRHPGHCHRRCGADRGGLRGAPGGRRRGEGARSPARRGCTTNAPDNRAFHWEIGDRARTEAALKGAAKVVKARLINQRLVANAIEPRASLASYQPGDRRADAVGDLAEPARPSPDHGRLRARLSRSRSSGSSPPTWAADSARRSSSTPRRSRSPGWPRSSSVPVRWTAQRTESFVTDAQGRDHVSDVEMGFDASGKVAGLRVKTVANLGAYLSLFAPAVPTYLYGTLLNGLYDFPAIFCEVDAAFTHTVPVDALPRRGASRGLLPPRADDGHRRARAGGRSGRAAAEEPHRQALPLPDARWRWPTTAATTDRRWSGR